MAPKDYSDLLTVTIVPHVDAVIKETPAGPMLDEVEHNQFRVFVAGDTVKSATKTMLVGFIGKQPGANFCPIGAFYNFTTSCGKWIAEQAKQLHGQASPQPHTDVPPPL